MCPDNGPDSAAHQHFAIILAAGFSTRMGVCKTTLPWHNHQTLLRYQTEQFLQAGITPVVVLGCHNAHRQEDCAVGTDVVVKVKGDDSKAGSILAGLSRLPKTVSTITISAVDQPRSASIYTALLRAYQQQKAPITAPCYHGKLGHPVMFSCGLRSELENISDESLGLRQVIQSAYAEINLVVFSRPEVLIDINDESTYQLHQCCLDCQSLTTAKPH
ncbi:MAG: nucleotidyltransferase family protein [Phormidesmis sp. RL_2_1]|nr:nucleotidyltransferase family protein [Phormidesmis sp. RL_2_1]